MSEPSSEMAGSEWVFALGERINALREVIALCADKLETEGNEEPREVAKVLRSALRSAG